MYQEHNESRHAHPKQRHRNGKLYNNKRGGIARSAKAYKQRDIPWTRKYQTAVRAAQDWLQRGQHGSNLTETGHANTGHIFPYLSHRRVHIDYIPSTQLMIKNALNDRKTKYLIKDKRNNPEKYSDVATAHLAKIEAYNKDTRGIDAIRDGLDDYNHGILYYPHIDRTQEYHLQGFDETKCYSRVSKKQIDNHEKLLYTVYTSKKTFYGDFSDPSQITEDLDILLYLQEETNYTLTTKEIRQIINTHWYDTDNEFDLDEDDFVDEEMSKKSHKFDEIVNADRSHPMFTTATHGYRYPNNPLYENIKTINSFSQKTDTKSARQARELFTNVLRQNTKTNNTKKTKQKAGSTPRKNRLKRPETNKNNEKKEERRNAKNKNIRNHDYNLRSRKKKFANPETSLSYADIQRVTNEEKSYQDKIRAMNVCNFIV